MTDYAKVLLAVAPHGKPAVRAGFAAALDECIARADLSSKLRLAHFLAQTAEESAGLATTVEYASGRAYEGRKDLGNVQKGDGVRFKGRGLLQITGRANYSKYGKALGVDLVDNPDTAAQFPVAALTGAEYWKERRLNIFADKDSIEAVTLRVNGGENGLSSREAYLARAKHALSDLKGALVASASVETQKATTKTRALAAPASTAAFSAVSLHPAAQSPVPVVAIVALIVVAIAVAAGLGFLIYRHQKAASALTEAANGV